MERNLQIPAGTVQPLSRKTCIQEKPLFKGANASITLHLFKGNFWHSSGSPPNVPYSCVTHLRCWLTLIGLAAVNNHKKSLRTDS